MKFLHIEAASYIENFKVRLTFNDGTSGIADLQASLDGSIFEPLKEKEYFKRFKLEGHTLSWDNGADFAPEYLKSRTEKDSDPVCGRHPSVPRGRSAS
ncbi:MAG: DUF2442 domain-containing protein [Verrucomicrobiota bacterium]|nr:DUF2442 domain-containing protein [Verrucomicrobiota bacterium]